MERPAHLPLASWHLREGEVCGQLWDFSVTVPRPPSPGHWLLRLLGKRPVGGAALPQREGPSGLTDLPSLRAASSAPETAEGFASGQRSWAPSSPASEGGEWNGTKRSPEFLRGGFKKWRGKAGENLCPRHCHFKRQTRKIFFSPEKLVCFLLSEKESLAPRASPLGQASLEAMF